MRLGVTPRSNAHRLQIAWNCDSHFCSPVLDWTVRSSSAFSGTGPDCSPRVSDRTVRSFYRSPFELETGLFFSQTGPYFSVWTAVLIGRTVRSGLFQWSTNKATVRTRPNRGQSISKTALELKMACVHCSGGQQGHCKGCVRGFRPSYLTRAR